MEKQKHEANVQKTISLVKEKAPKLLYHNAVHALDVWNVTRQYAIIEGLPYNEKQALEQAALLHDIILVNGRIDNEERSAEFAREHLSKLGYSDYQVQASGGIILATKWPQKPKTLSEKIICDSDLDNLGRQDFLEKGELLRREWSGKSQKEWYEWQLDLLRNHNYFTESARKLRNPGKRLNIQRLERVLEEGC